MSNYSNWRGTGNNTYFNQSVATVSADPTNIFTALTSGAKPDPDATEFSVTLRPGERLHRNRYKFEMKEDGSSLHISTKGIPYRYCSIPQFDGKTHKSGAIHNFRAFWDLEELTSVEEPSKGNNHITYNSNKETDSEKKRRLANKIKVEGWLDNHTDTMDSLTELEIPKDDLAEQQDSYVGITGRSQSVDGSNDLYNS
ncbi:uncharacterized protein L201_002531 [Kwoniella dendrophila CBS 6074]|uniref:Uncharacterized protein n=1 Tax=Kwoniella dendrophila CBS 6074 TaxID=1295534 RepID=A0AAX4JQG9_9TREE